MFINRACSIVALTAQKCCEPLVGIAFERANKPYRDSKIHCQVGHVSHRNDRLLQRRHSVPFSVLRRFSRVTNALVANPNNLLSDLSLPGWSRARNPDRARRHVALKCGFVEIHAAASGDAGKAN